LTDCCRAFLSAARLSQGIASPWPNGEAFFMSALRSVDGKRSRWLQHEERKEVSA